MSIHTEVRALTLEAVSGTPGSTIVGSIEGGARNDQEVNGQLLLWVGKGQEQVAYFHPKLSWVEARLYTPQGRPYFKVFTVSPEAGKIRVQGQLERNGKPYKECGFIDINPICVATVPVENVLVAAKFMGEHRFCMASDCTGAKGNILQLRRSVFFSLEGDWDGLKVYCGKCFDAQIGEKCPRENVVLDARGLWLQSPVQVMLR